MQYCFCDGWLQWSSEQERSFQWASICKGWSMWAVLPEAGEWNTKICQCHSLSTFLLCRPSFFLVINRNTSAKQTNGGTWNNSNPHANTDSVHICHSVSCLRNNIKLLLTLKKQNLGTLFCVEQFFENNYALCGGQNNVWLEKYKF